MIPAHQRASPQDESGACRLVEDSTQEGIEARTNRGNRRRAARCGPLTSSEILDPRRTQPAQRDDS